MRKYMLIIMALCLSGVAKAQWISFGYEYWFDNDRSTLKEARAIGSSCSFEADVSGLSESLHAIHIQANTGEDHKRTVPVTRYFVKTPMQGASRCWFDNDYSTLQKGVPSGEAFMLDVENLKDGFHIINVQAEGEGGGLGQPKSYPFVKIPQVIGVDHLTCLCMIDDKLFKKEDVPATGGIVNWQFDVSSLPQGFHRMFVQVVTPSGAATALYQSFFMRETTRTEFSEMKCVYSIDGTEFNREAGVLANGTFHFDLDVADLDDGLHRIAYMLSNGKGVTTKVQTHFFTKIPIGGYGTVEYWYWLNDQQGEDIHKVKLTERQNPFSMLTLLPVDEQPIRSSQFEFRIVGGKPYIYAKNTFHARFYDASGRFVDLNSDYVDERVHKEVAETTTLEAISLNAPVRGPLKSPETTIKSLRVDRMAENEITWFKMTAEPGDSLQFHLDRAATMQLFSPSGKEVYSAGGADALQWGGVHAEENGTYYLALHDVTATYGSSLTLYYEFIDKYAVLRQDVSTVGNGGPSTITFQGNGFDKLNKVKLVNGGTTLNSVEIGHEGNATTSVKFDFGGAPLGDYDAVFQFEDEDITVKQCVTVEQAVPVVIDGYVIYAPQFLVSVGNQYDFRITNHGNQSVYDRPMCIRVFTTIADNIKQVIADGVELTEYTETTSDSIPGLPYVRTYSITRTMRPSFTETYLIKVLTSATDMIYVFLDDVGGGSQPVNSLDPNDIYGYQDSEGNKNIPEGVTDVYYTIEFENDPEFATASAHDIYVTDKLDNSLFDLSTYKPTRIEIGGKEAELSGDQNFVTTLDMRPEINAVAQIEGTFDSESGTASWHISSLDPMTMEPTTVPMDGVLPVNQDGEGIGCVSFDISLKPDLAVNTEVPNKATIVFDTNEAIETPTWVNVIGNVSAKRGDVDDSGRVDISDVVAVINHIAGVKPIAKADVTGDNRVDISDVVEIINIIAGIR